MLKYSQYLLKALKYLEKNIQEEAKSTKKFTFNILIKNRKTFNPDKQNNGKVEQNQLLNQVSIKNRN